MQFKQCTRRTREEKGIKVLYESKEHQCSIIQLGEETELSNHTSEACESFISVYTAVKAAGSKVNDVGRQCPVLDVLSKGPGK